MHNLKGALCKPKLEIPPSGTGDPPVLLPVVPPLLVHSHPGDSAQKKLNRGHGDPDKVGGRPGMLWAPVSPPIINTNTHTYTLFLSLSLSL